MITSANRSEKAGQAPFPVTVTCGVLGFFTRAFCKWLRDPVSQCDWD